MKHRTIATALLLAGFATPSVSADDGLARCARIAAPTERLDCYDDLANVAGLSEVTAAPVPAAVSVTLEPAPPSEPEAAADAMDAFGFEKKIFREKNENEELVARYVGEFTGWTGGTLFKLDNGQVWKQAQSAGTTRKSPFAKAHWAAFVCRWKARNVPCASSASSNA
jgi:hypothetical protein